MTMHGNGKKTCSLPCDGLMVLRVNGHVKTSRLMRVLYKLLFS